MNSSVIPVKTAGRVLTFRKGLRDGLPICLGYLSVSFAYGMMAVEGGLPVWAAVLISMTNLTSSGQVAGTSLIFAGGSFLEIGITTFVINIRYMLMSLSLSQKVEEGMSSLARSILAFGNTDEVFAVAMQQHGRIPSCYLSGLILMPYFGWTLGTLLGAACTGILPLSVRSALGIAIYGMFIAIIIPPARQSRAILATVVFATGISCLFAFTPVLNRLSSGWVIILCAILAAGFAAYRFPVDVEPLEEEDVWPST
ncbi:MAG: AzlC family ABC transporter permease [Candidatus Merdivicinus sp.]